MPKVDRELVALKFAETGNKRKTADALGVHYNTVVQALRGLSNRCVRCGGPAPNDHENCSPCRDYQRDRKTADRAARRNSDRCFACSEARAEGSKLYCAVHREAAQHRSRESQQRKSLRLRGARGDEPMSPKAREAAIRRSYGPDAVALWQEMQGCCEICSTPYGQASIQIHHVDEDRKNNARTNLAVLCFDCHQATHRLLVLRKRTEFLSWFARRYAP